MFLLLRRVLDPKEVRKRLRKLGLKKKDIKEIFFANCSALALVRKKLPSVPSDLAVSDEEVEEIVRVHRYVEKFKYLLDLERLAEIEVQEEEMGRLSGRERELLGRAILDLKGAKAGTKFHFNLVRFGREKPIETEISSGDLVLVSRGNPLKSDLVGTVTAISERTITVAFDEKPPRWVYKKGVRIDLYVNDVTFKRMEENLEFLRHAEGRSRRLRNILLGLEKPAPAREEAFEQVDKGLNESQKTAVALALGSEDFFLIHGPPGTGKTRTLTELIVQLVRRGKKVLATADSNTAVDNLLVNLLKYPEIRTVRIGHPARMLDELEHRSIYAIAEEHEDFEKVERLWEEVRNLIRERDRFTKPVPSLRRGLSDEEIIHLAERERSYRGVSGEIIRSMASWINLNRKISSLIDEAKKLEDGIFRSIIESAHVVLSTNSMAGSDFLKDVRFDVAVIDEGSQQVEPSTLIPVMKAETLYIAGDHKQLPPTVMSESARDLEKTLFERLLEEHEALSSLLRVQYRMNDRIMEFPSREFYGGKLVSAPEVKNHTLEDLKVSPPEKFEEILDPREPIAFLDTSSINAVEFQREGSTSYENFEEAEIVTEIVKELLSMGVPEKMVGVITPYSAQVKLIKQMLFEEGIRVEVNSVDGFQGREKEVIVISFVRSNDEGNLGFLEDIRRLNVAITRARRKLVCVGNARTLSVHPVYRRFIRYVKERGVFTTP